jgi:hypothetical protein
VASFSYSTKFVLAMIGLFTGSMLLYFAASGMANGRYFVDFAPGIMVLTCVVILARYRTVPVMQRRLLAGVFVGLTVWSVAVHFAISFPW